MPFIITPLCVLVRSTLVASSVPRIMATRHNSYMALFKESLKSAKNVAIVTGDDISTESGVPIYGKTSFWRKYQTSTLATSGAFLTFPSLVWEFYHYRREMAVNAQPNEAHKAIALFEEKHGKDKSITVITQSIDGLHSRANTKNLIELHGSLFKTRCIKCNDVVPNNDHPICEALANKGSPDSTDTNSDIPEKLLPHCSKPSCTGLLRPDIVWYGDSIDPSVIQKAEAVISACDLCLVVGSPSLLFPAAQYAPDAMNNGAIIAEFNNEMDTNSNYHYSFVGPCSVTLPEALDV
ncbi:unnamed protein product [Spodoptera littoralis]|uniref:Deacetylase sirtuin-type domain-containing protein n=1 Tax=Spodoptera littoralis TaxID=7109 RepID=A0A9P0IJM7_SPOLI|nr:unnamed protein product [Spodoptera littoralis]CAH1647229.1 unnamed protein product [Spodoptera littoralis]